MKAYCDYCGCEFDEDELIYLDNEAAFICPVCERLGDYEEDYNDNDDYNNEEETENGV